MTKLPPPHHPAMASCEIPPPPAICCSLAECQRLALGNAALQAAMAAASTDLPNRPTYKHYGVGLASNWAYVSAQLPKLLRERPLRILDVGPGIGCFMYLCRALGHDVQGLDQAVSGAPTLKAFKAVTKAAGLPVSYLGFNDAGLRALKGQRFDLVHFRGSFDGVVRPTRPELNVRVRTALQRITGLLAGGGSAYIAHNMNEYTGPTMKALQEVLQGTKLQEELELCRNSDGITEIRPAAQND